MGDLTSMACGLRRSACEETMISVSLGASRLLLEPPFSSGEIPCDDDRVLISQLVKGRARPFCIEVQDLLHQERHVFGAEKNASTQKGEATPDDSRVDAIPAAFQHLSLPHTPSVSRGEI